MDRPFEGLRIAIDGVNVSLRRGTGIASYARGLAGTVREGGGGVEFVFDARSGDGGDPLLREVGFVEARPRPESAMARRRRVAGAMLRALAGIEATPLPAEAASLRAAAAEPLPEGAALSLAPDLADAGEALFRRFGRFARVRPSTRAGVFHWTAPMPLKAAGAKNIYTIHDLVPLRLPQSTLDDKSTFVRLLRKIVAEADHILTVSEHSRRDILSLLGAPPDKVSAAPPAVDVGDARREAEGEARAFVETAYGLSWGGYYLYFGAVEPKKNVGRLLDAYAGAGLDAPLVMVSSLAWLSDAELRLLQPYTEEPPVPAPLAARLRRLDYLPRRDLWRLIRGARAVLFPSVYEGFGLPAAEAMALGAPVLASRGHALEEVCGDAALLVDPLDPLDIRAGLVRLDADAGLRRDLAARGPRTAARYSRDAQAQALRAVYDRLADPA